MSKADVLALVQTLCGSQADTATIDRYYDDAVHDLAKREWLTNATLLPVTATTAEYTTVAPLVAVLDAIYDNVVLDLAPLRDLEAIDPEWRSRTGHPLAYTVEDEPADTVRLYPAPDCASGPFIWLHGSPLGLDYPANALCVIHTETRTDIPAWLELPVALRICGVEFTRDSNHRDPVFARYCARLADFLIQVVG